VSSAEQPLEGLRELGPAEAEAFGLAHTLPEILQQPSAWIDTFERVRQWRSDLTSLLQGQRPPDVVMIGAGSSDFAAQLVAPAFRKSFGVTTHVLASTDLLTQTRSLLSPKRDYLFVWFSRSGTTPEALELLTRLDSELPCAHHLFITCNARGAFARRAPSARSRCLTLPDAVHDRGLAMTSSFTSMALAGLLLAMEAPRENVADLSSAAQRLFDRPARDLFLLAQRRHSSMFLLGSGSLKAAAGECALKLLELSAGLVKTRFDSFLGARHGPLSSLDRETALVGFLSGTPSERVYELELVREVQRKQLAGAIVLVTPEADPSLESLAEPCIDLGVPAHLPELFRPLLDVVAGQLLALFTSLALGVRPDSPSPNGAISRVVTRIRPSAGAEGDETG
jgi:tagatose-6-phosphate ketose/aldose isomerase